MPGINWALASSGGVASASSSSAYFAPPSALNDGERAGSALGRSGNVWQNFADAGGPVWAQIALPAVRAIDAVVVYSQQTLFLAPVEPYADMRTRRGMASFNVEAWIDGAWVEQAQVRNNDLVRRVVPLPASIRSDRVRVVFVAPPYNRAALTEIEAWEGTPPDAASTPPRKVDCFRVGARRYSVLKEALAILRDGETLDIDPGDYREEDACGQSGASGITINCHGATFYAVWSGKAAFTLEGDDVTINDAGGVGLFNADGNGGLIRFEGRNCSVNNLRAFRCEMPYLSGLKHSDSVETIVRPYIRDTEGHSPAGGIGHGLYFGRCAEARVIDPDIEGTVLGHLVKSRSARTVIAGGRLAKGPHTSRVLDQALGGRVELGGNLHIKSIRADNPDIIGFGAESWADDTRTTRAPTFSVNVVNIAPGVVIDDELRVDPVRFYIPGSVTHERSSTQPASGSSLKK